MSRDAAGRGSRRGQRKTEGAHGTQGLHGRAEADADNRPAVGSTTGGGAKNSVGAGWAHRAAAVRAAVAALPGELREAIVLFEYEEMSQAEIAAMLGCSVKAVESRVARAKEKLRAALARWV